MANPILEILERKPQMTPQNNLVQAYKTLSAMENPNKALKALSQQNPMIQQAIQLINSSQMSPKDLFYNMARQRGIDPSQVLNMFR